MKNKKLYFVGLGISNIAACNFLAKNNEIIVYDDSKSDIKDFQFAHYQDVDFSTIDYVVLTPAIPLEYPTQHPIVKLAKEHNVPIIGDIELFFMQFKNLPKIIGITGTNGKSTTTSLIYHLLKENLEAAVYIGGNIGKPVFELPIDESAFYVIEISSFQLDLLNELEFDYSVLLNITPDHIDRHKDFAGYVEAKMRIFSNKIRDNVAIVCVDEPITQEIFDGLANTKIKYYSNEIRYLETGIFYHEYEFFKTREELNKFGNPQNLIAGLIVLKQIGFDLSKVKPSLDSFVSLEHRFERVASYKNLNIYNDSKATNAESTENALKQLDNIYWIAGGIAKDGGIAILKKYFPKIKKIYLYGKDAELFKTQIDGKVETKMFEQNFQAMIADCIHDAIKEDSAVNILFSPSCASFDMFANFVERGKEFKKQVMINTKLK